jgi:hypothetical protein
MDGENYNIGFVDVTNRPYAELAGAARETHDRLAAVHAGKTPPFPRGRALQSTGRRNRLGIKFGGDPDAVYRAFRA